MRWWSPCTLVLILTLSFTAPAQAGEVPQDDAGLGRDAPDVPIAQVTIHSGIVYDGMLVEDDFQDWYGFAAETGQVAEVRVVGEYGCFAIADPDGTVVAHDCTVDTYEGEAFTTISATIDSDGIWFLRYSNVPADVYRFSLGLDEPAPSPLPMRDEATAVVDHAVDEAITAVGTADNETRPWRDGAVENVTMIVEEVRRKAFGPLRDQDDAGSGRDAGDTPLSAVPIETGVRHWGNVSGKHVDDVDDWYAFDVAAGEAIEARFLSTLGCVAILDPAGEQLARACMGPSGLEAIAEASAPVDGTYHVAVQSTSYKSYRFSTGVDAPAPSLLPS